MAVKKVTPSKQSSEEGKICSGMWHRRSEYFLALEEENIIILKPVLKTFHENKGREKKKRKTLVAYRERPKRVQLP